jgi:hypothetical protein
LGIKLKNPSQYFSEQILVDHERLIVILPISKKKLFYSKYHSFVTDLLNFDNLERFITINGGFIKDF